MYKKNSKEKKETILVGMTLKIESIVTAYLLKKQGYNCIGVSIVFMDQSAESNQDLPYTKCHIEDLNKVKAVCDHLKIPFYAVNGSDFYKEYVIEHVLVQKLEGNHFYPCVLCNKIKIELLVDKARGLGADKVATGHYVKLNYNNNIKEYQIGVSNDTRFDQSYFLTNLSQEYLKNLMFPLSEMRYEEVFKIVESIGVEDYINLDFNKNAFKKRMCFIKNSALSKFVENRTPKSLRMGGGIHSYGDDNFIGEHDGITNYTVGDNNVQASTKVMIDGGLEVVKIDPHEKSVYLGFANNQFIYNSCNLKKFISVYQLNISSPINAFAQFRPNSDKYECILFFKNNENVVCYFKNTYRGQIPRGSFVVLYSKQGVGGMLLGGGEVLSSGQFTSMPRIEAEESYEDEEDVQRIFNFEFKF